MFYALQGVPYMSILSKGMIFKDDMLIFWRGLTLFFFAEVITLK